MSHVAFSLTQLPERISDQSLTVLVVLQVALRSATVTAYPSTKADHLDWPSLCTSLATQIIQD
eukprot:6286321-Karenia_brevis.AAC.1